MGKHFLIFCCFLFLSFSARSQTDKKEKAIDRFFSARELKDVKVVNPHLFVDTNVIFIRLKELVNDYSYPLPGGHVISDYGLRGNRRAHSGVDIKTHPNDTIRATFDGVVRIAKPYFAYGNIIVIRHAKGIETLYSHNSKNFVKQGETVKAGQAIGLTGRTGRATTAHVHFEIRFNGQHFDPNLLFDVKHNKLQDGVLVCSKRNNTVVVKLQKGSDK
jgi:murein DD-endopeptidase MepM/ murein hydrolase activator NlpD